MQFLKLLTDSIIENMMGWHHSGFNVYCGERIWPSNSEGLERLAQYIIRAPICQERMIYIPAAETKDGVARVIYQSKDGKGSKTFTALDWLGFLITLVPIILWTVLMFLVSYIFIFARRKSGSIFGAILFYSGYILGMNLFVYVVLLPKT